MVLEITKLWVREGVWRQFEATMTKVLPLLTMAEGYVSHELQRSLQDETRYVLLIEWDGFEEHALGFRQSRAHAEWHAALSPYYELAPEVGHYAMVAGRGIEVATDYETRHYSD
jgi:heme-degrading monooxygenase HmoA